LNSRGARTDPCGTPLLRRRNLLLWLFLVVRLRLRLPTISIIMWIMCLPGRNRRSLQVRPRCHTVSWGSGNDDSGQYSIFCIGGSSTNQQGNSSA